MAEQAPFEPVLPFIGVLYTHEEMLHKAIRRMERVIPSLVRRSNPILFDYTDYYNKEIIGNIMRIWIASEKLADASKLADWKIISNAIEREFSMPTGRTINIDPGFIGLSKIVLASCKDHPQRIPLKDGIYAEIELTFRHEEWIDTPWTYRDYSDFPAKKFFTEQRNHLLELVRREEFLRPHKCDN